MNLKHVWLSFLIASTEPRFEEEDDVFVFLWTLLGIIKRKTICHGCRCRKNHMKFYNLSSFFTSLFVLCLMDFCNYSFAFLYLARKKNGKRLWGESLPDTKAIHGNDQDKSETFLKNFIQKEKKEKQWKGSEREKDGQKISTVRNYVEQQARLSTATHVKHEKKY